MSHVKTISKTCYLAIYDVDINAKSGIIAEQFSKTKGLMYRVHFARDAQGEIHYFIDFNNCMDSVGVRFGPTPSNLVSIYKLKKEYKLPKHIINCLSKFVWGMDIC